MRNGDLGSLPRGSPIQFELVVMENLVFETFLMMDKYKNHG